MADDLTDALIRGTIGIGQHGLAEPPRPWREHGYVGEDEAWRPLRMIPPDAYPTRHPTFRVGAEWPRAAATPHVVEGEIDRVEIGPMVEGFEFNGARYERARTVFPVEAPLNPDQVSFCPLGNLLPSRVIEALLQTMEWSVVDRGDDWYRVAVRETNQRTFSFFIKIQTYGLQEEEHGTP